MAILITSAAITAMAQTAAGDLKGNMLCLTTAPIHHHFKPEHMSYSNYGYGPCRGGDWQNYRSHRPAVNIEETDSTYTLSLYAPALVKEQLAVATKGDVLTVRYQTKETEDRERFTRKEYPVSFERSFDLKGKVETDRIEAVYTEGVLKITLPKTAAAQRPEKDVEVR